MPPDFFSPWGSCGKCAIGGIERAPVFARSRFPAPPPAPPGASANTRRQPGAPPLEPLHSLRPFNILLDTARAELMPAVRRVDSLFFPLVDPWILAMHPICGIAGPSVTLIEYAVKMFVRPAQH